MRARTGHKLPPEERIELVALADIARGGMGKVQLARVNGGRLANKFVAVKRLNHQHEKDQAYVDMFLDETWMTSAIRSPNVVGVEAWGHDQHGMYLAIELVQGVSLSRLIKEARAKSEPFAERTVACILTQVCAGLEVAHELRGETGEPLGLVHRDLTPGNILVGFDGIVKIADFGIAKSRSRLTETSAGVMKGKPAYMAPEQARGMEVDRRADLFSVGVILYELLAGKRPWAGDDDLEMLINVSTTEPIDLGEIRRAHAVFLEISRRCLQKDRDKRFGSARELRERIDKWRMEKGFVADDLASLSQFVRRNTPQQIAWYERALAGGLVRGGSTFKEVEEKLDRERGIAITADPRIKQTGPSAPAPPAAIAPTPIDAFGPESRVDELGATRQYNPPGSTRATPAAGQPRVKGLSGTVALDSAALSPPSSRAAPFNPSLTDPGARSVANPLALGLPPPRAAYPQFQPGPAAQRNIAPTPDLEVVAPTVQMSHDAPPSDRGAQSAPSSRTPNRMLSETTGMDALPPKSSMNSLQSETTNMGGVLIVRKKRSRAAFVVLFVVLLLLAAAAAVYFFRDRMPFHVPG